MVHVQINIGPEDRQWLTELLASLPEGSEITVNGPGAGGSRALPGDVQEMLARANPQAREPLARFLAGELSDRNAQYRLKTGRDPYVRLLVPGPQYKGSYVYANMTGKVTFRLPGEHAQGCQFAHALDVVETDPYRVRLYLTSADALEEAHRLAGEAAGLAQG